jgi:hypothetical protein
VAGPDDASAEYREFAREMILRFERAMRGLVTEMREGFRLQREESRAYFEIERTRLDELIEQSRAQRQALLHILDRLDDGGPAAA